MYKDNTMLKIKPILGHKSYHFFSLKKLSGRIKKQNTPTLSGCPLHPHWQSRNLLRFSVTHSHCPWLHRFQLHRQSEYRYLHRQRPCFFLFHFQKVHETTQFLAFIIAEPVFKMKITTKTHEQKCFMIRFLPEITAILIKLSRYDNYLTDVYHMEYKIKRFSPQKTMQEIISDNTVPLKTHGEGPDGCKPRNRANPQRTEYR